MRLAKETASWSKDPSVQVGAICVDDNGRILSQGYNGFPRFVHDSPARYNDRKTKLKFVVHAEQNAIYNACYNGVSLKGSNIFVSGLPVCHDCAKGIIQA
jgi:dCMP deaminase